MQFGNSQMLVLLVLAPGVFGLLRWLAKRRHQQLSRFTDEALLPYTQETYDDAQPRKRRRAWWSAFVVVTLVFSVLRPQWGFTWKESSKSGVDIVVAVDVSQSMLAEDVKPSRLVRARREVVDLIQEVKGDRVGLVAFAGVAFTETPLTLDYGAFRNFVSALEPGLLPIKGSNIEAAILESIRTLRKGQDSATTNHRAHAIILITDGESFDGDVIAAGEKASDLGIKIYIVGIGTLQGAPIPSAGGHKKDKNGKVVISRLQPTALEQLAKDTGGVYVKSISSDKDTLAIYDLGIRKQLEAKALEWGRAKRWNEHFQIPLFCAIALMLLGPWGQLWQTLRQAGKKSAQLPKVRTATNLSVGILVLLHCGFTEPAFAQSAERLGAEARQAFEDGDFEGALKRFDEAASKSEQDHRFRMGQAASHYRLQKFEEAKAQFFEGASLASDTKNKAEALYNAGNSMVQLKEFEDAIKTYKDSLALMPDDVETQENLAFAKRMLELQKQQKEEKEQDKKDSKESSKDQGDEKKEKNQSKEARKEQEDKKQQSDQQENDPKQNDEEKRNQQTESPEQELEQEQEQENNEESEQQQASEEQSENTDSKDTEEQEKQAKQDEGKEENTALNSQANSSEKPENEKKQLDPASQMQLESVEEKPNARFNYRFQKAMKQLKLDKRKPPEKDW